MNKRTKPVSVQLTDSELKQLDEKVHKSGLSRSSYLRDLVHHSYVKPLPKIDYAGHTEQLREYGKRIDEIARVANSTGYFMADEYKEVMDELMTLLQKIVTEVEKPVPCPPVLPPENPRVWRPRKPHLQNDPK